MTQFNKLYQKFKNYDVKGKIKNLVKEFEPLILDLNISQHDDQGISKTGEKMWSFNPPPQVYSPVTIAHKQGQGQRTDILTLHDTGAFHSGFFLEFVPGGISIWSSDWKADMLVRDYDDQGGVFGLIQKNLFEVVQENIYPELMDDLRT